MVDSVNLYASNAYGKVQSQQITRTEPELLTNEVKASDFQNLVKVNFNQFAKLSPSEILNKISAAREGSVARGPAAEISFSSAVSSEISKVRDVLVKQESQAQKASMGQANLVDLMTATTQAENYLSTLVTMRDELKTAWEKIWSMSL